MILFLITGSANGMDVLLGTVISVEQESGKVVLEILQGFNESDSEKASDKPKEITIMIEPERIPPCVAAGKIVRIWGDYIKEDKSQFKAVHISGGGFYNQKGDPTGVRSRIGKCNKGGCRCGTGGKGGRGH